MEILYELVRRLSDVAQANTREPQPDPSLEARQKQQREEFQRRHPDLGAPTSMPAAAPPTDEGLLQLQFSELKARVKKAGLMAHLDILKGKAGAIHLLRHGPDEPPAPNAAPKVLVKETDSDEEIWSARRRRAVENRQPIDSSQPLRGCLPGRDSSVQ